MTGALASPSTRSLVVRNQTLPPWDREPDARDADLTARLGQTVVTGSTVAAQMLGIKSDYIRDFIRPGFIRDARIVERRFVEGGVTHICVAPAYPSRLFLEYGERLIEVTPSAPEAFEIDSDGCDADGRVRIVVRPRLEGTEGDLLIVTSRRMYRVRLVSNPRRLTLALSWSYPVMMTEDAEGHWLGPPGEIKRRRAARGNARLTRYVVFELGTSMRTLFDRWVRNLSAPSRHVLAVHKLLHARLSIPTEEGYPEVIIEAVFRYLSGIGNYRDGEIRQFLKLPPDAQAYTDDMRRRATGIRRERLALGRAPTSADLAIPFPFLSALPETCLDDEEVFAEPPERARRLVWAMGPLAEHAALFCMVAPRHVRRPDIVSHVLSDVAALERIAARHDFRLDLHDPESLSALMSFVLTSGASGMPSAGARLRITRSLFLTMRVLRRYVRLHDPQDVRGLHRLRPGDPGGLEGVGRRIATLRRAQVKAGRTERKRRVFEHAGRLTRLECAAGLNLEQIVVTNMTLKAAAAGLGEADWIDVSVPLTIVDDRGRLLPGRQRCVWRIWNRQAFLGRLLAGEDDGRDVRVVRGMLSSARRDQTLQPVYEYRRTVALTGASSIEPFFVRCSRYGLAARPASLPARLRHKRHMLLQQLKLPGSGPNASGLLQPDQEETSLWRVATRLNRTVVFLDPFEHALRFAHLGLSSVLENCSRTNAWLQQTQDRSGWAIRRLNGGPVAGFLAFDKVTARTDLDDEMSWFPVGPRHQLEMQDLIRMTCERCGYGDGMLPELPHLLTIRWKRPEKEAWIFAHDGKVLDTANLLRFLRYLLPGFGRLTYHDFRHLVANAAFEAGVPGWMIRLSLNHGRTDMWVYYAEQNERQRTKFEARSLRAVVERTALARNTSSKENI